MSTLKKDLRKDLKKGVKILGGDYLLSVSPDKMCALLEPLKPDAVFPRDEALKQLREFLKTQGIISGLHSEPRFEGGRWVLAEGKPPMRGKDARLEWFVPIDPPDNSEAKKVDLRERNAIICVDEGERIAKLHPPTSGVPGKDIFGEEIPPQRGRELQLETNEWVDFDPETGVFRALKAGVLRVYPSRIEVHPEFWLDGNVDWDTGNVRFRGEKLTITGDVKRGFKLFAQGDVEIHGNIEDETEVVVNGDLLVEGLVHGEGARLLCQGNARLGAIEYARVEVKGDLVITDYALQAEIQVGRNFICTEGVGAVVGGRLTVEGGVLVRILGSRAHVATLIRAGYNHHLAQRIEELESKLLLLREEKEPYLKILKLGIKLLKEGELPRSRMEALARLKKKLALLLEEEKKLQKQLEKLRKTQEHLETKARIKATNRLFPGVTIEVGPGKFTVAEGLPGGVFFLKNGILRYLSLSEK